MSKLGFVFYGERPSLDFVNTFRKRKDPFVEQVDTLETLGLRAWLDAARKQSRWAVDLPGWLEGPDSLEQEGFLDEAKVLREAIYQVFASGVSTELGERRSVSQRVSTVEAADLLTAYAAGAPRLELAADGKGHFNMSANLTGVGVLGFVASDAIQLCGGESLLRVKECAHARCGILFEDRSNGMKRQWCSMQRCGNRSKAQRRANRT